MTLQELLNTVFQILRELTLLEYLEVLGGLGLFLLGMKNLSEGMQAASGERLRKMLNAITDNRLIACSVGTGITAIIQSSSVTTVMVVSMVNAGLMNLRQAIGVIMGSNIGTTITAWIVSMNLLKWGLPILGVAAMIYLFSKKDKVQFAALVVLGIGMIFFGLQLMTDVLEPLKNDPAFSDLMAAFQPDSFWKLLVCVLIGALATAIIQSSSASIAVIITIPNIPFETAVALLMGANIGTTITVFLASLGMNTTARRAAYAHIFFNIIGVALMIPLFHHYTSLVNSICGDSIPLKAKIAFSHTGFNVFGVLMLLPLIKPYTRFVEFLIPAKKIKEKSHLTFIDISVYDTPSLAIEQSHREIVLMGDDIHKMMEWLRTAIVQDHNNRALEDKLFHREEVFDHIQKEIIEFIDKMLGGTISHLVTTEARIQLRIADEYESISDYIISVLKLKCKLRNNQLKFTKEGEEDILILHDSIVAYLDMINSAVKNKNIDTFSKIQSCSRRIVHQVKDIRSEHLSRLEKRKTTPLATLIFMDMLSSYRRIQDHSLNIGEALAGKK